MMVMNVDFALLFGLHQKIDMLRSNNVWDVIVFHNTYSRSRTLHEEPPARTFQHFMEPEGSIPCSQEPSIGPYPETYRPNPYHPILSL
jgi:hypothetical protein